MDVILNFIFKDFLEVKKNTIYQEWLTSLLFIEKLQISTIYKQYF